MIKALKLGLLATGPCCLSLTAQAFMIDDFTQGPDTLAINSGTGNTESQETGSNIPGTQRDTWLSVTSNPFNQSVRFVIPGNSTGASFYNGDAGTTGFVQLDYDGVDTEGNDGMQTAGPGMNLNLAGQTGFQFTFLSADSPVRVDVMAVTYGTNDFTSVGSFATAANINSSTSYTVNFSDLTLGGGSAGQFNPADTDRLVFRFTPENPSGDFALGSISTVPEPCAFGVVAAGLIGLLRRRRRA